MTIAEDVASLWQGVLQKPARGAENAYYADLLRRVMQSKKQLEETGRKYSILPDLRELTRKTMVRIPAQHVPYLEVSVFDLISNPLKTHLQPFVSEFSNEGADFELVSWFVRHAKKEPALALDFKVLQSWYEKNKPVEPVAATPADASATSSDVEKKEAYTASAPSASKAPSSVDSVSPAPSTEVSTLPSPSDADACVSPADTTVSLPSVEGDGTAADRIFENG